MENTNLCAKCGRKLKPGSLKYFYRVESWAAFDGILPEQDSFQTEDDLKRLLDKIKRKSEKRLEKDVYYKVEYIVCSHCRERLMVNPLNLPLDTEIPDSISDDELQD